MAPKTNKVSDKVPKLIYLGKGMKNCLIVSLLFHLILLFAIQISLSISGGTKAPRTYPVEFLQPDIDDLLEAEEPGSDSDADQTPGKIPPELTEETISLDTKDQKYSSYVEMIKERLMQTWQYPEDAKKDLLEGDALVLFTLGRNGSLAKIQILTPSGFDILDKEAVRAIQTSAPFPPFPSQITVLKLHIRANFAYRLTAHQTKSRIRMGGQ